MGKAIADAEWIVTVVYTVKDTEIGQPIVMRYADSVVAKGWDKVATLIAGRLDEARERFMPQARQR
jgi:hypothetical protein